MCFKVHLPVLVLLKLMTDTAQLGLVWLLVRYYYYYYYYIGTSDCSTTTLGTGTGIVICALTPL